MQKKEKIAISINKDILEIIDSRIDDNNIRSRSQAIEILVRQSIREETVQTAVMLIHCKDLPCLFKEYQKFPLIQHHLNFLLNNRIKKLYIIVKTNAMIDKLLEEVPRGKIEIEQINDKREDGTAAAISLIKDKIDSDFVVINGDTFNDFDLRKMIRKHKQSNKIATMGLISSMKPTHFGAVILDGEEIIEFREKEHVSKSNIINAGVYILKPTIFHYINERTKSLERDVFSILAAKGQLIGYFTHGNYVHVPEL